MANLQVMAPPLSSLQELQLAFCLLKLSGDFWIIEQSQIAAARKGVLDGDVQMFKFAPGKLAMQRHLEMLPVSCDPKKVVADFMVSPNTSVYDAVAFSPLPTPPDTLNYWSGSPIVAAKGDWASLKGFMLWVICDGDIGLYRYLVMFLAHMLQKPEQKPGIMMVLLGGQGTGKGTFFELLRAVWPHTMLQVSDVSHVIGQFNAGIERNYVICMDEALFAGDKKGTERLKSFVTEPVVTIEQKYQPRRTIASFHRFFSSSNHAHFAQVDADDRRFMFLRVSEAHKGDHTYWASIHRAIEDPAIIAAMVHDLEGYSLNGFNVRARPKSQAHADQKLRSLNGFDRYWYEVLQSGKFGPSVYPDPMGEWSELCFISTCGLMGGWKDYERGQRSFSTRQERDIHSAITRLCPSAGRGRHKPKYGDQQRGYFLPTLAVARTEFAHAVGADVAWDD